MNKRLPDLTWIVWIWNANTWNQPITNQTSQNAMTTLSMNNIGSIITIDTPSWKLWVQMHINWEIAQLIEYNWEYFMIVKVWDNFQIRWLNHSTRKILFEVEVEWMNIVSSDKKERHWYIIKSWHKSSPIKWFLVDGSSAAQFEIVEAWKKKTYAEQMGWPSDKRWLIEIRYYFERKNALPDLPEDEETIRSIFSWFWEKWVDHDSFLWIQSWAKRMSFDSKWITPAKVWVWFWKQVDQKTKKVEFQEEETSCWNITIRFWTIEQLKEYWLPL